MNKEIGLLLVEMRSTSKLTQKQVAERLSGNQTRISRIEAGESDMADVSAYLDAIGTPEAEELNKTIRLTWANISRPSLRHPNLDTLIEVERGLQRVGDFLKDSSISSMLSGQAQLLQKRLEEAGQYLLSLNHDVVYVGDIGVGKTTAACRQAGLVADQAAASDLKGMLLDTGGGRTTLCDVHVQVGERFAITVEPVSDEEIYKLVGEICRGIFEKTALNSTSTTVEFKPAEEVERALRNMSELPRPPRGRKGMEIATDPALELAKNYSNLEHFTAEFAARLSLWRRKKRSTEFDGVDSKVGRLWLRSTFTAINNGRDKSFSLPARIIITVPFALVSVLGLSITVIDTRGVDGSAVRPDIVSHLKDPRAVTLLCSKWGSAPDSSTQNLLTHVNETDGDATLLNRVAILALARQGDALSMRHDSGEAAEDIDEGYDIKIGQIEDAFQKIGIASVNAFAFDASIDDPTHLTKFILSRLRAVREVQASAARATIEAINEMIENRAESEAIAALDHVSSNLKRFADRNSSATDLPRAVHDRLIKAVKTLNARTVWAATRRSGRFWNLDMFQYLGDGAAAEAKLRSSKVQSDLNALITSDLDNHELHSTHGFLTQIQANAIQWEADFINATRHHAMTVYLHHLSKAQELWDICAKEYGSSAGSYRDFVASKLTSWFEENENLQDALKQRVARAWERSFISPLKQAVGQNP